MTLTIDANGGLFLPAQLLEKIRLQKGTKVSVDIGDEQIIVKPAQEEGEPRVIRKGKFRVITGLTTPFDAVAAIQASREEREEQILNFREES